MSAHHLSTDIVHEILVNVPDFTTLLAVIQSCKMFNNVFKAHPKSIVHEVAANVVGCAVPQAARCAQYCLQVRLALEEDPYCGTHVRLNDLPEEEHYRSLDWMPSKALTKIIEENHKAVRTLEEFYSQRHKDRTSPTSKLEPEESLRFQRAMYRYWLYLDLQQYGAFSPTVDSDIDTDDDDDDDGDDDDDDDEGLQFRLGFKEILQRLSTDELFEVLHIGSFCEETSQWQTVGGYPHVGIHPADLAGNMEHGYINHSDHWPLWSPVAAVINDILTSRKVKQAEVDMRRDKAIVQTINGAEDTCARCHAVGGLQLIGAPNITLLSGLLPIQHWQMPNRLSLLPGLLYGNDFEGRQIKQHLLKGHNGRRVPEGELFNELIDTVPDADGNGGEEQHQWSKDEWYCLECVKDLFRQRFMVWWRQTKLKNGAPHQDDCWYGYNCRTMRHRVPHALKLNHLCTPTRGDDPSKPPQQPNNPN